jgi:plastocyanin
MRTALAVLLAALAAAVLAACGSSSGGGTTVPVATSTEREPTSELKTDTTPNFAAPSSTAPVLSGLVPVAYRNISIHPDTLRVKVGSTVRWTNFDSIEHNVTSQSGPQSFASSNIGEGGTFQVKLTRPGVIHYLCTIHPTSMNGTIEVVR